MEGKELVGLACADLQLICSCREGRKEACSQLLARYEGYIYSLCYRFSQQREDALELTQEAMIKVVAALPSYQANRPFKPWLRRVVINACLNVLRQKQPESLPLEDADRLPATASGTNPAEQAELWEAQKALQHALAALPPLVRLVVVLRHQEGLRYQEIAEETGLSPGTVRTYLHRGRQQLRQALRDLYAWEA